MVTHPIVDAAKLIQFEIVARFEIGPDLPFLGAC
jgi:hypothetical protein